MKTNNIEKLRENGFSVNKTKDINTVISHDKPFKLVREGKEDYSVPINENNQYTVTVGGYPEDNQIAYTVVQYETPLIYEINESAKQSVVEIPETVDTDTLVKFESADFGNLGINTVFYKTDDGNGVPYVKVDETVYVKSGNTIGSAIELVADSDEKVFVEMLDDELTSLSIEQKKDIVDHAPEGLSPEDFAEYVAHDLENIPGLETLGDEDVEALISSLSQLYFNQ